VIVTIAAPQLIELHEVPVAPLLPVAAGGGVLVMFVLPPP